jgi:nicotinamide phosphoribosyltransferase
MIADWLKLFPTGILSIVGDTFDLFSLITEYLPANKEAIMNRNGKLVIRPDSGDPVDIICGMDNYRVIGDKVYDVVDCGDHAKSWRQTTTYNINQIKGVIELLWDIFGGTINEQGYKVLDPHIGAIYGDSINLQSQIKIYEKLEAKGFATTNIVLGVGSFTYQMNTRDTLGFAAKGSWFATDDEEYNIYKDPITDDGTKKSLKGRVAVNPHFTVKTECTVEEEAGGILQTIYENGTFTKLTTLTEIRETINGIV